MFINCGSSIPKDFARSLSAWAIWARRSRQILATEARLVYTSIIHSMDQRFSEPAVP